MSRVADHNSRPGFPGPVTTAAGREVGIVDEHGRPRDAAGPDVALTDGLEPPSQVAPPSATSGGRGFTQRGDKVFAGLASGSGWFVVVLIGAIGLFLLIQAVPALLANKADFFTFRDYVVDDPANLRFGILNLLAVTVESSVYALVLAMPVGLGIALFLTQYAPPKLARPFSYLVDLLAAVPSIVYGMWGLLVLGPALQPLSDWLTGNLGWFFLFRPINIIAGANLFIAGIVLAVMILPIITAITREVFIRTPRAHIEAALALGATRWEVIRMTVLPFGKAGFVSASMLGLGRALGETVALMIILAIRAGDAPFSGSLFDGGSTFASKIALAFAELNNALSAGAYIAAGLVLFVLTFAVNAVARWIVSRGVAS